MDEALDKKLLSASIRKYPLLIHQIYFEGLNNIPDKWRDSPIEWKRLHPDHTYTLWNSDMCDSLIKQFEPQYYDFYCSCSYDIQRTLLVRYALMKRYGGIYSSIDVTPLFSMSDKIKECDANIYVVKSDADGISFSTSLLISKRNCSLWSNLMSHCSSSLPGWCIGSYCEVSMSLGYRRLTECINDFTEPIQQLSYNLFSPFSFHGEKYLESKDSGSWYDWDSIPIRLLFKYRESIFLSFLLIAILLVLLSLIGLFSIRL